MKKSYKLSNIHTNDQHTSHFYTQKKEYKRMEKKTRKNKKSATEKRKMVLQCCSTDFLSRFYFRLSLFYRLGSHIVEILQ